MIGKILKNVENYNNNTFEKTDRKSKFTKVGVLGQQLSKKDIRWGEKMSNEISLLNNLSPNNFDKITQKISEYLENEDNTKEVLKELIIYTMGFFRKQYYKKYFALYMLNF